MDSRRELSKPFCAYYALLPTSRRISGRNISLSFSMQLTILIVMRFVLPLFGYCMVWTLFPLFH